VRTGRLVGSAVFLLLACAACSSSSATATPTIPTVGPPTFSGPTPTAVASTEASPSTAPTSTTAPSVSLVPGQATASLTLAGLPAIAHQIVRCQEPTLTGGVITVSGAAPDNSYLIYITVSAGHVKINLTHSEGASFYQRMFEGSGVAGFDAATGASLSGDLAETTPAGTSSGTIGAPASISGSVDCNGQQRGTAAITVSGTLPEGTLSGRIETPRVECVKNGTVSSMFVIGLMTLGDSRALVSITIDTDQFDITVNPGAGYYELTASGAGTGTLTDATSGTVAGTATGTGSSGGPTQSLQVSGSATCGTTVTYGS
jgi:hypothetical protein